jgi:ubiquitin carboxyl-terminal hydrolase L5
MGCSPFKSGPCSDEDWTQKANEVIMERMRKYSESEIHFSLMAVTKDRMETIQERLDELGGLLMSLGDADIEQRREFETEISILQHEYEQEQSKHGRWRVSSIYLLSYPQLFFIKILLKPFFYSVKTSFVNITSFL